MKTAIRAVIGLLGVLAALGGLQWYASESGEVVVLTTTNDSGEAQRTRLWVVDYEGSAWLRAGVDQKGGWYERLLKRPDIDVDRDGVSARYTAQAEPDARAEINRLMAEKYGWADDLIGVMVDHSKSVPIRLLPRR